MTDGKSFGELNGEEGIKACRAALATYPDTPRFEFQLARSLHKVRTIWRGRGALSKPCPAWIFRSTDQLRLDAQ